MSIIESKKVDVNDTPTTMLSHYRFHQSSKAFLVSTDINGLILLLSYKEC